MSKSLGCPDYDSYLVLMVEVLVAPSSAPVCRRSVHAGPRPLVPCLTTSMRLCRHVRCHFSPLFTTMRTETAEPFTRSRGNSLAAPPATLGILHSLLEPTIVPVLAGAVLKESPSDFVVIEEPLFGGNTFTPDDPSAPLPENVRKPPLREVCTLSACVTPYPALHSTPW